MKTGWPLTIKENVKLVASKYQIVLPNGEFTLDRFTTVEKAQEKLKELNKEQKKRGGRPNAKEKKLDQEDKAELFDE